MSLSGYLFIALGLLGTFSPIPLASARVVPLASNGVIHRQPLVSSYGTKYSVSSYLEVPEVAGQIRYVENTGICETTSDVYSASGYVDLNKDMSMFFWFFAARKEPETAPLTIWLNGGPGSSSMYGLFNENGPCRVSNDSKTLLRNEYSWNEYSNMLYIDEPIGAGYSYGNTTVTSTREAAAAIYQLLQIFFADPKWKLYVRNKFSLWTESYGGHYGPTFAAYFQEQNEKIKAGELSGGLATIQLETLGIGNGMTDPLIQFAAYPRYALYNSYKAPLSTLTAINTANNSYYKAGGCRDLLSVCYRTGTSKDCYDAHVYCNYWVFLWPRLTVNNAWDFYDVREKEPNPYPPEPAPILTNPDFMAKIGAEKVWQGSNEDIGYDFLSTGDNVRSSKPDLEKVINSGVRTFIFAGDADYICNYMGVELMVDALETQYTEEYRAQKWRDFTVDGTVTGIYKSAGNGNFAYMRVLESGHLVPAYGLRNVPIGKAALIFFEKFMKGESFE